MLKKNTGAFIVTAVPVIFFAWFFGRGLFFSSFDTMDFYYVVKRWYWDKIWAGEFPLWNSGIFGGIYQVASPPIGIFSPFTALFYSLFSGVWAEQLQLPLFAAIAAVGFYLLARRLTASEGAAVIMGLAYALSGPLLSLPDRSHIFYAAALYPWCIWSCLRVYEKGRWRDGLTLASLLALVLIYSDWTAALILSAIFVAWWAVLEPESRRRSARPMALSLALALGLSAVAVLPAFENLSETMRAQGLPYELASVFSFHPLRLVNLILPEMWGQIYDQTFWGKELTEAANVQRFWFHSVYVSIPILLAAFWGLAISWSRPQWKILALTAGACLLIAFGSHFPLHPLLFEFVAPYRSLRYPEKFVLYSLLAVMVFAALGLGDVLRRRERRLWLLLAGLQVLLFAASGFLARGGHWPHLVLAVAALVAYGRRGQAPWLAAYVVAELLLFQPAQLVAPMAAFTDPSPLLPQLQARAGRFLRDPILDDLVSDRDAVAKTLQNNWHLLAHLDQVFGYDTVRAARVLTLDGRKIYEHLPVWARVLDITSVLTSISPRPTALEDWRKQGLLEEAAHDTSTNLALLTVRRKPEPVAIYLKARVARDGEEAKRLTLERGEDLSTAVVEAEVELGDGRLLNMQVLKRQADEHVYQVQNVGALLFVERENFHPAWHVYVDGKAQPLLRVDYLSRGVVLPDGNHTLEFKFEPRAFYWAAWISALSVLTLLIFLFRADRVPAK